VAELNVDPNDLRLCLENGEVLHDERSLSSYGFRSPSQSFRVWVRRPVSWHPRCSVFCYEDFEPENGCTGKGSQSPHCAGGIPLYRTRYPPMSQSPLQRFALYLLPPRAHTQLPHRASGSVPVPPSTKSCIWRATPAGRKSQTIKQKDERCILD
jgi:hypothetical protein